MNEFFIVSSIGVTAPFQFIGFSSYLRAPASIPVYPLTTGAIKDDAPWMNGFDLKYGGSVTS